MRIHERKYNNDYMTHVMDRFHNRFGKEPPSCQILITCEMNAFRLEIVSDASPLWSSINPKETLTEVSVLVMLLPCQLTRKQAAGLENKKSTMQLHKNNDLASDPASGEQYI